MRHFGKRILCGFFSVCLLSTLLCNAVSTRSSDYLDDYGASITPISDGKMVVTVEVSGVGRMTQLGATTIYIYESVDNKSFTRVATYEYEDYPKMMGSGKYYCEDAVTHSGTPGYYYFASVYCYAANAKGSDEKNYTTSVKRAIA